MKKAKDTKKGPIKILGVGEGHDHGSLISQMPDLTRTYGRKTGPRALEMAGLDYKDIDLDMILSLTQFLQL